MTIPVLLSSGSTGDLFEAICRQVTQQVKGQALAGKAPISSRHPSRILSSALAAAGKRAATGLDQSEMKGIGMSASEEMVREQLIRIIARTELRIEQLSIHISGLAPYGEEIKRKGGQLASMLTGLVKLKTLRKEYPEPQTRARLPTLPVTSLIRPSASSGKRAEHFWPDGSHSRAQSE